MGEIWKNIPGYKDIYQVSNLGKVRSLKFDSIRLLKPGVTHGYKHVILYKENNSLIARVHKLVAIVFLNHIPNGHKLVINHINFNKLDNRVVNLEIVTSRENGNKKHLKNTSKYTGVCWDRLRNKWLSSISLNGKCLKLGRFINENDAHNAYQNKLKQL